MIHELKTWPKFFDMVAVGLKTFDLRKDDRGFQLGDTLVLKEYLPDAKKFTGNELRALVICILEHNDFPEGLSAGYVVIGFEVLAKYMVRDS